MNHTLDRRTYSEMESESEMNCESESRKVTNLLADLGLKLVQKLTSQLQVAGALSKTVACVAIIQT